MRGQALHNNPNEDDPVMTGNPASEAPISRLFAADNGANALKARLEELTAVNDALHCALGDVHRFEADIAGGREQLRAASIRIAELEGVVATVESHLANERERVTSLASALEEQKRRSADADGRAVQASAILDTERARASLLEQQRDAAAAEYERICAEYAQAHSSMEEMRKRTDDAEAAAERLRERLDVETERLAQVKSESNSSLATANQRLRDLAEQLERESAGAVWAQKLAERLSKRLESAETRLARAAQAFAALEDALDAVLAKRRDAAREAEQARDETIVWVQECERLLVRVEQYAAEASALRDERQSLLSTLDERNEELLTWLDTAEQLHQQVQAAEQLLQKRQETYVSQDALLQVQQDLEHARVDLAQQTALASYWRGHCETAQSRADELSLQIQTLEDGVQQAAANGKATQEEARHWRGRSEALESHLNNARADGAQRAKELERDLELEKKNAAQVRQELADLTERFAKVAQVEIARTRSEIMHLSGAINSVQAGRSWQLKHWIRRILGQR